MTGSSSTGIAGRCRGATIFAGARARALAVITLAIVSGLRPVVFGFPELRPDTSLYAQGGLGVFPSPLGRLVGLGGETAVAALNALACVLLVLVVAQLAAQLGGSPVWAAALVVLCPLSWWSMFSGTDTIAAVLLVSAAITLLRGHRKRSAGLAALAAGFHMAAFLVIGAALLARSWRLAAAVGALALVLVLATPYRDLVLDLDPFTASSSATFSTVVFVLCLPVVLLSGPVALVSLPAIVGGAAAAGVVASAPWETNMRYLLPAVAFGAAASGSSSTRIAGRCRGATIFAGARARAQAVTRRLGSWLPGPVKRAARRTVEQ